MDIDGLQQAEGHPGPQEEHMVAEDHDTNEETSSQDESLCRMSIFCLHTKRSLKGGRNSVVHIKQTEQPDTVTLFLFLSSLEYFTHSELMVNFVDVFVDLAVMQQAMEEVVPSVFNNCTAKTLSKDIRPAGVGQRSHHLEVHLLTNRLL